MTDKRLTVDWDRDHAYRSGYELVERELANSPRSVREDAARRIDELMETTPHGTPRFRALLGARTYLIERHETALKD